MFYTIPGVDELIFWSVDYVSLAGRDSVSLVRLTLVFWSIPVF